MSIWNALEAQSKKKTLSTAVLGTSQDIRRNKINRNKKILICNEVNHCRGNFKVVKLLKNFSTKRLCSSVPKMTSHTAAVWIFLRKVNIQKKKIDGRMSMEKCIPLEPNYSLWFYWTWFHWVLPFSSQRPCNIAVSRTTAKNWHFFFLKKNTFWLKIVNSFHLFCIYQNKQSHTSNLCIEKKKVKGWQKRWISDQKWIQIHNRIENIFLADGKQ